MTKKTSKQNGSKMYKFDIGKWEYVEKDEFVEAKSKPNAILYARVSDQKQIDEWNWIDSQIDNVRKYADRIWATVVKVFTDEAISGAKLTREGINDAIKFLKQQNKNYPKIGYFLCTEISRISRSENIGDTTEMIKEISSTWVNIITTFNGRNVSSTNINDSFITDIDIIQAKHERLKIRERSMNWTTSKLYNWVRPFSVPSGYERRHIKVWRRTEKILEQKEPEASIIKEWLELFAEGIITNNTQLLHFLNEKQLTSNFHTPNPWKLELTYVQRLFEIEKLYFYAGFIIYPNRGITKPIEWQHQPLISLSIANKILNRLWGKGMKAGIRKDTSDLYPLRGIVRCPLCDYPMTARPSKGKMGTIYHYYGCNRKDCKDKENINVDKMHEDFIALLKTIKPKPWVIKLLEASLKETIKEKEKVESNLKDKKKKRIRDIEIELNNLTTTISKVSKAEMIQTLEEKRADLNTEKEILEEEIDRKGLEEKDFENMYNRLKNIIEDPVSIWDMWTIEMKILLARVLFGENFYYTKKEGYQTPHLSALYRIISTIEGGIVTSGADDETRTRNQQLGRLWL